MSLSRKTLYSEKDKDKIIQVFIVLINYIFYYRLFEREKLHFIMVSFCKKKKGLLQLSTYIEVNVMVMNALKLNCVNCVL